MGNAAIPDVDTRGRDHAKLRCHTVHSGATMNGLPDSLPVCFGGLGANPIEAQSADGYQKCTQNRDENR
jgi:hypothetical protein